MKTWCRSESGRSDPSTATTVPFIRSSSDGLLDEPHVCSALQYKATEGRRTIDGRQGLEDRPQRMSTERLVEVMGVAGAGKSTVTQAMCATPGFTRGAFIRVRTRADMLRFVRGLPRVVPIVISSGLRRPLVGWRELKLLAYVTRWLPVLRRDARVNLGVTVLDQGPIYALVRLTAEGKPFSRTRAFRRWSDEMLHAWTREISAVVWLDAPDDVLWERINGRSQSHTTKGERDDEGYRFISRYRDAFEATFGRIEALDRTKVFRFDTEHTTADQLADTLRPLLTDHE
jgi:adenylate kinase family enzyme